MIYKIKILLTIIIILLVNQKISFAKENKILFKINNEIITSIDILNEIRYLNLINKDFKSTNKNLKIEIAKNSLIREKIKNNELNKLNINFDVEDELFEKIIQNNLKNLNISNKKDFNLFFKNNDISPLLIKKKILIEVMWKQLIYNKFYQQVKIDKNKIEKEILRSKTQKEYLLSEIMIETESKQNLENKFEKIKTTIKNNNFSVAALNHSISETSKNGGKLGWIKENVLSQKIKDELNKIETGKFTEPILIPGGFLILKIEDIRKIETKLDINNQIKSIIEKKTNEQLSMFSNIYFKKLKKNTYVDEL